MISKRIFSILSVLVVAGACSSSGKHAQDTADLSLESADSIQLGTERQDEITQRFGSPSLAVDIPSRPSKALLYCEKQPCTEGHLTFHISKENGLTRSVTWIPARGESNSLDTILNHYKTVAFKRQRFLYNYGDYMYEVETYKNRELGINIGFDPYKKVVTYVDREDPKNQSVFVSHNKFPIITELLERETASRPEPMTH